MTQKRKTTFDGKWPLIEDDLWRKMTLEGRQLFMEETFKWNTTFYGSRPFMEDDLWWNTAFYGRRSLLTLLKPTLLDSSRVPGGGADLPPLELGPRMSFSLFFQDKVLAFDVKGENLNAQPSTIETVVMNLNKKWYLGQESEKHSKFTIWK